MVSSGFFVLKVFIGFSRHLHNIYITSTTCTMQNSNIYIYKYMHKYTDLKLLQFLYTKQEEYFSIVQFLNQRH